VPDRGLRNAVQVLIEQVRVHVEGLRRGGVAEHRCTAFTFAPALTARLAARPGIRVLCASDTLCSTDALSP